jgi:poly-gamma-glutamate capsule biosynthesis protein CapA/YwtB (metallophosphatase superfamily)
MYMSRTDSRSHEKQRKKRRLKKLMIINGFLLVLILILAGTLYASNYWPFEGGEANDAPAPSNAANAANDANDTQEGNGGSNGDNASVGEEVAPDPAEEAGADQGDAGAAPVEEQPVEEAAEHPKPADEIRLAFVGDILLAASVEALMNKNGTAYPYEKALPFLQEPDLTAGNLENPITTRGIPAEDKQYVFKGSPGLLTSLKEAGIDVVSLANNHTMDQGVEGLLDTIAHLDEAGIANMGGGKDADAAFRPVVLDAQGISVAYFGLSRVVPDVSWKAGVNKPGVAETYDSTRAKEEIAAAREKHDLVVVFAHWGEEKSDHPRAYEKQLARDYIDAGADLVVGAHPHVLQGFEQYKGKWIAYSLGNFIFNMTATDKTKDTGVLDAVCSREGECKLQLHPMRVKQASQPTPIEGEEAKRLLDWVESISMGAVIDEQGYITSASTEEKKVSE